MFKISNSHEKLENGINSRWKSFTEDKIQIGIFQEHSHSSLSFVIAMMPLNYIIRKCTGGHKFSKSQEKINYLMYMDNITLFEKKKKKKRKRKNKKKQQKNKLKTDIKDKNQ